MRVIGLTGGIGSGKTAVAERFRTLGIPLIDTDEISRQLTRTGGAAIPALVSAFGADVLDTSGALDRAAMRQRAFSDNNIKVQLEAILHPLIRRMCDEALSEVAKAHQPYCLLAVPLLFESMSYRGRITSSLLVDCPEALQLARVAQRSGLGETEIRRIMATQLPRALRLQLADDVISNAGKLTDLDSRIAELHTRYSRR